MNVAGHVKSVKDCVEFYYRWKKTRRRERLARDHSRIILSPMSPKKPQLVHWYVGYSVGSPGYAAYASFVY